MSKVHEHLPVKAVQIMPYTACLNDSRPATMIALCDDGSMWLFHASRWELLCEAPPAPCSTCGRAPYRCDCRDVLERYRREQAG